MIFYTFLWGTAPSARAWDGIGPLQLILTALFVHPFVSSATNSVVPGGWSIGVEMEFYVIFPFLAAFRPRLLLMVAFIAYLSLGILGTSIAERFGSGDHFAIFLYYSMLTQFPIFPIGMFVYASTLSSERIRLLDTTAIVVLWLAIAFIGKFMFSLNSRPFFWVQIAVLAVIVWSAIRWGLGARALAYIGKLSYSMYLSHFAILYFEERMFGNRLSYILGLLGTLLGTVTIAIVSQKTAEKWSQDVGRRVIASMERRAAARALLVQE